MAWLSLVVLGMSHSSSDMNLKVCLGSHKGHYIGNSPLVSAGVIFQTELIIGMTRSSKYRLPRTKCRV